MTTRVEWEIYERDALPDHFWAKVLMGTTGCWYWMAATDQDGYGILNLPVVYVDGRRGNRPAKAHRYFYERFVGDIPYGLELDHLCRTRSCVNPTHVEPVTHAVNMLRAWQYRVAHQ